MLRSQHLLLGALGVFCFLPSDLSAQAPFLRAGNKEFNVFGGVSFGKDQQKGMGGANFAYALNKVVMPYFEVGYFPGVGRKYQDSTGSATLDTRIVDYHGGLHLRLPIAESRFVPYAVIAAGGLRQSTDATTFSYNDGRGNSGRTTVPAFSGNTFAVNGGGGFRYYIGSGEKYGFRVEAKIYKPTSAPTLNASSAPFGKIVFGFFWTWN